MQEITTLLKQFIKEALLNEKERKKKSEKSTPGGGLTDSGARRRVNHTSFISNVRNALNNQDGDVRKAAATIGVAPRTFYYYLEDEPTLQQYKDLVDSQVKKREKVLNNTSKKPEQNHEDE